MWEMFLKRAFLFRAAKIGVKAYWARGKWQIGKKSPRQKARKPEFISLCQLRKRSIHYLLNTEGA